MSKENKGTTSSKPITKEEADALYTKSQVESQKARENRLTEMDLADEVNTADFTESFVKKVIANAQYQEREESVLLSTLSSNIGGSTAEFISHFNLIFTAAESDISGKKPVKTKETDTTRTYLIDSFKALNGDATMSGVLSKIGIKSYTDISSKSLDELIALRTTLIENYIAAKRSSFLKTAVAAIDAPQQKIGAIDKARVQLDLQSQLSDLELIQQAEKHRRNARKWQKLAHDMSSLQETAEERSAREEELSATRRKKAGVSESSSIEISSLEQDLSQDPQILKLQAETKDIEERTKALEKQKLDIEELESDKTLLDEEILKLKQSSKALASRETKIIVPEEFHLGSSANEEFTKGKTDLESEIQALQEQAKAKDEQLKKLKDKAIELEKAFAESLEQPKIVAEHKASEEAATSPSTLAEHKESKIAAEPIKSLLPVTKNEELQEKRKKILSNVTALAEESAEARGKSMSELQQNEVLKQGLAIAQDVDAQMTAKSKGLFGKSKASQQQKLLSLGKKLSSLAESKSLKAEDVSSLATEESAQALKRDSWKANTTKTEAANTIVRREKNVGTSVLSYFSSKIASKSQEVLKRSSSEAKQSAIKSSEKADKSDARLQAVSSLTQALGKAGEKLSALKDNMAGKFLSLLGGKSKESAQRAGGTIDSSEKSLREVVLQKEQIKQSLQEKEGNFQDKGKAQRQEVGGFDMTTEEFDTAGLSTVDKDNSGLFVASKLTKLLLQREASKAQQKASQDSTNMASKGYTAGAKLSNFVPLPGAELIVSTAGAIIGKGIDEWQSKNKEGLNAFASFFWAIEIGQYDKIAVAIDRIIIQNRKLVKGLSEADQVKFVEFIIGKITNGIVEGKQKNHLSVEDRIVDLFYEGSTPTRTAAPNYFKVKYQENDIDLAKYIHQAPVKVKNHDHGSSTTVVRPAGKGKYPAIEFSDAQIIARLGLHVKDQASKIGEQKGDVYRTLFVEQFQRAMFQKMVAIGAFQEPEVVGQGKAMLQAKKDKSAESDPMVIKAASAIFSAANSLRKGNKDFQKLFDIHELLGSDLSDIDETRLSAIFVQLGEFIFDQDKSTMSKKDQVAMRSEAETMATKIFESLGTKPMQEALFDKRKQGAQQEVEQKELVQRKVASQEVLILAQAAKISKEQKSEAAIDRSSFHDKEKQLKYQLTRNLKFTFKEMQAGIEKANTAKKAGFVLSAAAGVLGDDDPVGSKLSSLSGVLEFIGTKLSSDQQKNILQLLEKHPDKLWAIVEESIAQTVSCYKTVANNLSGEKDIKILAQSLSENMLKSLAEKSIELSESMEKLGKEQSDKAILQSKICETLVVATIDNVGKSKTTTVLNFTVGDKQIKESAASLTNKSPALVRHGNKQVQYTRDGSSTTDHHALILNPSMARKLDFAPKDKSVSVLETKEETPPQERFKDKLKLALKSTELGIYDEAVTNKAAEELAKMFADHALYIIANNSDFRVAEKQLKTLANGMVKLMVAHKADIQTFARDVVKYHTEIKGDAIKTKANELVMCVISKQNKTTIKDDIGGISVTDLISSSAVIVTSESGGKKSYIAPSGEKLFYTTKKQRGKPPVRELSQFEIAMFKSQKGETSEARMHDAGYKSVGLGVGGTDLIIDAVKSKMLEHKDNKLFSSGFIDEQLLKIVASQIASQIIVLNQDISDEPALLENFAKKAVTALSQLGDGVILLEHGKAIIAEEMLKDDKGDKFSNLQRTSLREQVRKIIGITEALPAMNPAQQIFFEALKNEFEERVKKDKSGDLAKNFAKVFSDKNLIEASAVLGEFYSEQRIPIDNMKAIAEKSAKEAVTFIAETFKLKPELVSKKSASDQIYLIAHAATNKNPKKIDKPKFDELYKGTKTLEQKSSPDEAELDLSPSRERKSFSLTEMDASLFLGESPETPSTPVSRGGSESDLSISRSSEISSSDLRSEFSRSGSISKFEDGERSPYSSVRRLDFVGQEEKAEAPKAVKQESKLTPDQSRVAKPLEDSFKEQRDKLLKSLQDQQKKLSKESKDTKKLKEVSSRIKACNNIFSDANIKITADLLAKNLTGDISKLNDKEISGAAKKITEEVINNLKKVKVSNIEPFNKLLDNELESSKEVLQTLQIIGITTFLPDKLALGKKAHLTKPNDGQIAAEVGSKYTQQEKVPEASSRIPGGVMPSRIGQAISIVAEPGQQQNKSSKKDTAAGADKTPKIEVPPEEASKRTGQEVGSGKASSKDQQRS